MGPAGRLVCGEQLPPKVPSLCAGGASSSSYPRMRVPMTRAEVTEQNLIQAAMRGPPQTVPDLDVLSEEEIKRVKAEKEALALALAAQRAGSSQSSSRSSSPSSRCYSQGEDVTDGPAFAIGRAR